jgi:hypothetical protein
MCLHTEVPCFGTQVCFVFGFGYAELAQVRQLSRKNFVFERQKPKSDESLHYKI